MKKKVVKHKHSHSKKHGAYFCETYIKVIGIVIIVLVILFGITAMTSTPSTNFISLPSSVTQ